MTSQPKSYWRSKSGRHNSRMRFIAAFSALLIISSLQADDKDIIRDKSPDGKFALRISKDEQGGSAAIIDLEGKDEIVALEIYQNYTEEAHLVWSKDSQRVAYFEPDRRGGSTTVYFRKGSIFEEVSLPEIPECTNPAKQGETHVKTVEATTSPQKWSSSGALVLKVYTDDLMEKGPDQTCTQLVTIAFDASHKASVQSVKEEKTKTRVRRHEEQPRSRKSYCRSKSAGHRLRETRTGMKRLRLEFLLLVAILPAIGSLLAIASCKPTGNQPAPETQESNTSDGNAPKGPKDFGPTLLKIATPYWISYNENYNSLLYGRHCGFIDLKGKVVIEPIWEEVRDFSEGIARVKRGGGEWSWIDKAGRVFERPPGITFNKYTTLVNYDLPLFYEGLAAFARDGKWGFMDTKGTVVVKPEWDEVGKFYGGYAGVKRGGKWGGIDKTGRLVTPLGRCEQLEFQSQLRLWLIKREGKWGFMDMSGRVVVKPGWDDGGADFSEGLSLAIRDGMCGFIDKTGKVVIPFEWECAQPFSEGLAAVERNKKWGFIDKTGKFVIEPRWDLAMNFRGGLATVKQDGKWGAIDKTGKVVIEPQWNNSLPLTFHQGLACIQKDKSMGLSIEAVALSSNRNGTQAIPTRRPTMGMHRPTGY